MKKIKIIIAHTNKKIKDELKNVIINNIEYVDILDMVTTGMETLDAILKYEPDIVFMKYDMKDLRTIDLIEMTEQVLQEKTPAFKFLSDDLSVDKVAKKYDIEENEEIYIKEMGISGIIETVRSLNEKKM